MKANVAGRNIARPILGSVLFEFVVTFHPSGSMRVPDKTDAFQGIDTFNSHGTGLAFGSKLVLVSLTLDPSCLIVEKRRRSSCEYNGLGKKWK